MTMTRNDYDTAEGIRRSSLWTINKTPLHFKYEQDHPKQVTDSLRFGIAAHKLILEPEDFENEIAIIPAINKRTNAGKEEWAAFTEMCEREHKTAISLQDFEQIREMADAINANPVARELLTGQHEVPFYWTDVATGEKCKCKPDCMTEYKREKLIVDYKTTNSCEDFHFERAARDYGYKLQAGMYTEGVFLNTFEEYGFVFVAQEKNPPYAVRVYYCNESFIREGQDQFHTLLGIYHDCKESGHWYGYEGPFNMTTELEGDMP